jgi:peptidoglycan/xylan/chitin deacetylase (PgdA/CDA1 family)
MYHRIADDPFDPWGTIVSPRRFADQLHWLARERSVLPLERFAEINRAGELPANAIAITFDDGYSCTADTAAPILEELKLPATVFVPVACIERGQPFWWDEVRRIVMHNRRDRLTLGGEEIVLGATNPADRHWRYGAEPQTPRQHAFRRVWLHLLLQTPEAIAAAIDELRPQFEGDPQPAGIGAPMTADQVRRTRSAILDFGSHALSHAALTSLSKARQAEEIRASAARLEAIAGARPTSFAYPFGMFDETTERLVEEAGFSCACSVEEAATDPSSRPFALPRLQVGDWRPDRLKRALALLSSASDGQAA